MKNFPIGKQHLTSTNDVAGGAEKDKNSLYEQNAFRSRTYACDLCTTTIANYNIISLLVSLALCLHLFVLPCLWLPFPPFILFILHFYLWVCAVPLRNVSKHVRNYISGNAMAGAVQDKDKEVRKIIDFLRTFLEAITWRFQHSTLLSKMSI